MENVVGRRIRIKYMAGEPSYSGREGKIEMVDDIGQLHGTWGGLAVMPGEDKFVFLDDEECSHCGEFVYCNNGEGCDTCKYREE